MKLSKEKRRSKLEKRYSKGGTSVSIYQGFMSGSCKYKIRNGFELVKNGFGKAIYKNGVRCKTIFN